MEASSILILNLPLRPQQSSHFNQLCKPIPVLSNHFSLNSFQMKNKSSFIYIYAFEFIPEIPSDSRSLINELIHVIKNQIQEKIGFFFHSGMVLFAEKKSENPQTFETLLKNNSENQQKYIFALKLVHQLDPSSIKDLNLISNELIAFLNIQIKKYKRAMKLFEFGRTQMYFDMSPNKMKTLKDLKLDILPGFKTSLELYQGGLKLLVNRCSKILRWETALDVMYYIGFKSKEKIRAELIGKVVVAFYGNNRNYKITEVDFTLNPNSTFPTSDGMISYVNYYKKVYSIKIKDFTQPLLKVKQGKREKIQILLIPELVRLTGIPGSVKKNKKAFREISNYTCIEPHQRYMDINEHNEILSKSSSKMSDSVVQMGFDQFSKISASKLHEPRIILGIQKEQEIKNGLFNINKQILETVQFTSWSFIYGQALYDDAVWLLNELKSAGGNYGIQVNEPLWCEYNGSNEDFEKTLKDERTINEKTQFVLALLTPEDKKYERLYPLFKRYTFIEKPVPSQVVISSSIYDEKKVKSVCSKIILQINAKLGSTLWAANIENLGIANKDIMLIGADVFHNTQKNKQSVIGLCASFDPSFTKYYSRVKFQESGLEVMKGISPLISDCITHYYKVNKFLPKIIIFYRDGVGDSQYDMVRNIEIPSILNGFKAIDKNYDPKFCEILVNKRIDDKFFTSHSSPDRKTRYDNPPSGTWICNDVVSKIYYDFFLCAQAVNRGTTTPTHYTVIYDNLGLPEDILAALTYYQCFNYFNWNGAVRVPACAQYAHKVAYMAGETLGKDYHVSLRNRLVFL